MTRARDFMPLKTLKYVFIYAPKKPINMPFKYAQSLKYDLKICPKNRNILTTLYIRKIYLLVILFLYCKKYTKNIHCIKTKCIYQTIQTYI